MSQIGNSFRLNLFNSANKYFNFPRFKSTCVELKSYGGCSSAGQSTWLWPRRPWVQVPSLTQFSGYSVVRLTRLLWEQEIGSSNLSTPTLEEPISSSQKPCQMMRLLFFIYNHIYSSIPKSRTKKVVQNPLFQLTLFNLIRIKGWCRLRE